VTKKFIGVFIAFSYFIRQKNKIVVSNDEVVQKPKTSISTSEKIPRRNRKENLKRRLQAIYKEFTF
jgi:hypothetical protein